MAIAVLLNTGLRDEQEYQIFDVKCYRCMADLGTMSSRTVLEAMVNKGHIICQKCRSRICPACQMESGYLHEYWGVCWFCTEDLGLEHELDYEVNWTRNSAGVSMLVMSPKTQQQYEIEDEEGSDDGRQV